MMTDDEIIAVVKARKKGKKIQCRHIDGEDWFDIFPVWNFAENEYRVKPEPLVLFVNEYGSGEVCPHRTSDIAIESAGVRAVRVAVKMVESDDQDN